MRAAADREGHRVSDVLREQRTDAWSRLVATITARRRDPRGGRCVVPAVAGRRHAITRDHAQPRDVRAGCQGHDKREGGCS
jgi:hypothetical protein